MHITVVCPSCQTAWRLDGSMIGKRLLCPNQSCRQVFLVDGQGPPSGQTSGSVGEVVPILPAEPNAPAEPPLSPWHQNPAGWKPPRPSAKIIREPLPEESAPSRPNVPTTTEEDWRTAPPRGRGTVPTPPAPVPPPPKPAAPDWHNAPPPPRAATPPPPRATTPPPSRPAPAQPARQPERQSAPPPPPPLRPEPITAEIVENAPPPPVELPPGAWEAPPVRNRAVLADAAESQTIARKRRSLRWMIGVVVVLLVVGGGAAGFAWHMHVNSEKFLADKARQAYEEGLFAKAEDQYGEMLKKFPDSEHGDEYRFMVELAKVRKGPTKIPVVVKDELENMANFLRQHGKDPWMPDFLRHVGETYMKLVKDFIIAPKPDATTADKLQTAEATLAEMRGDLAAAVTAADRTYIEKEFGGIRELARKEIQRQKDLGRLREFKPTIDGIREADRFIREHGLAGDGDARAVLEELIRRLPESVVYVKEAAPIQPGQRDQDAEGGILVDPRLQGNPPANVDDDGIVLALARGVLYALAQSNGRVQWAVRVGIDTTQLPIRVPPTPSSPELILVQSADALTLTALTPHNQEVWKYQLTAPALGRPVLFTDRAKNQNRAFIPTFDGQIHEIELAKGLLLGRYKLGEGVKLSMGGVRQPETNLVYFPADEWCVFVIDVETHKCEKILYTKHRSGSLRGEPVLAHWTEKENDQPMPHGYLFLSLAEDLNSMRVEAYALPVENPRGGPIPMNPQPKLTGWTWFPPHQDAEKMVQVTDDGQLGLFGVQLQRTQDNPIFPLVAPNNPRKTSAIDLDSFLQLTPDEKKARGRSLIAYAEEPDNFWVLAHGKLTRLHLWLTKRNGPVVSSDPTWKGGLALGSPLHTAQVFDFPFERPDDPSTTLLLVTQPLKQQTCLATAVDAETGVIRWQRQLGVVCRGEPLVIQDRVLALDQGGGLFTFDIEKFRAAKGQWPVGGRRLASALDGGDTPPVLLPGPNGKSAYEFAIPATPPGTNSTLIVRYYHDEGGPAADVTESPTARKNRVTLAGKPAIGAAGILVPLSDGSVVRLALDGSYFGDGPNWKGKREEPELTTHIVWLNEEEFLTTDGGQKITRWKWKKGDNGFIAVPALDDQPTIKMPANVATAPVALAPAPGKDGVRALIACNDKTVYLVEGKSSDAVMKAGQDGLKRVDKQQWESRGVITGGPFLLGDRFCVIVDRNRLVCFKENEGDSEPKPVWQYKSEAEAIVGQPQLIDGMLVVADQSGRFVGLNPDKGEPFRKDGYKLRASTGPASSPVPFGPGLAFTPLTDGTILLLDLKLLRSDVQAQK